MDLSKSGINQQDLSSKDKDVLILLAGFLGQFGVDRFYRGHVGLCILKLITFGGCGIWALIDTVIYIIGNLPTDGEGKIIADQKSLQYLKSNYSFETATSEDATTEKMHGEKLRNVQNNIKKPAMSPVIKVFVWIGAILLIIAFIGILAAILIPQYEAYKQHQENVNISAPVSPLSPAPPLAPTPVPSTALDISGTWRGSLEGNGEMVIKSTPTGFDVALSISSKGCTASIEGSAHELTTY